MASEINSRSTLVYPEPLSKESDMRLNRSEMYSNHEKVNQYGLQKKLFEKCHSL